MKQVIFEEQETIHVNDVDFSKPIGFIDNKGDKCYFVYVGEDTPNKYVLHAVVAKEYELSPNISYGSIFTNKHTEFPKDKRILRGMHFSIKEAFVFNTAKELHKWLSED